MILRRTDTPRSTSTPKQLNGEQAGSTPNLLDPSWHFCPTLNIDGNPWLIAKDVCDALGPRNPTDALQKAILTTAEFPSLKLGKGRPRLIVPESGLYKLVLAYRKPEAEKFEQWVCSEVAPAIRKDGSYVLGEEKVKTGEMSEDELLACTVLAATNKVQRLTSERDVALAFRIALKGGCFQ